MKKVLFISIFLCFVFHNNATVLFVSRTGNDANDGSTWANAKRSIQSAIDSLQAGDSVFVSTGNFVGFTAKSGVHIYGGFIGFESHLYQRQSLSYGYSSNNQFTKITSTINASSTGNRVRTNIDGLVIDVNNAQEYAINTEGMPVFYINNCYVSKNGTTTINGARQYGIYITYKCYISNTKLNNCCNYCWTIRLAANG